MEKFRQISVDGLHTDWLTIEPVDRQPEEIVLFLPGNPSLMNFYKQFCRELFRELGGTKAVWSITMGDQAATGHSFKETVSLAPTPSLEKQLKHKAKFIDQYIPDGIKVSIIAYSISCYLLLALVKKKDVSIGNLEDSAGAKLIDSLYFIFPVIERMRDTPLGRIILPALWYFTWLILAAAFIALLFPNKIKFPIIKRILTSSTGTPPQDQFVTGVIEMIHPVMLKRVLNTLQEEIENVKELDIATIEHNRQKMVFYYGSYDGFCPKKYLFELRERVPDVNAYLCKDSLHHVYVTHTSGQMAHIMGNIMEGSEKKPQRTM
ncbi:Lipid droplet-associated hydrolase [Trinorchestia longiramus]|nr:Lipid droplet-associated hydrolase [Trinorchestia longiramus]